MYRAFGKRTLDIIVTVFSLAILAIPFVIIALCVKIDSKGPVFFRQKRAGRHLVPFTVYKFRTMAAHAPKNMPTNEFKEAGAYITRSGKIMRKLSIDELPQLFNVLKGEMSLVGPRPVVLAEVTLLRTREKYGANVCAPGITGWAQVNGRDELRIAKKAKMDGEYVNNFGFAMDVKCLLLTAWAVVSVKGHQEGHHRRQFEPEYSPTTVSEAE